MTYDRCPTCHGTGLVRPSEPKPSGGDRPRGSKPAPTPLLPLRRLQAADEATGHSLVGKGGWCPRCQSYGPEETSSEIRPVKTNGEQELIVTTTCLGCGQTKDKETLGLQHFGDFVDG